MGMPQFPAPLGYRPRIVVRVKLFAGVAVLLREQSWMTGALDSSLRFAAFRNDRGGAGCGGGVAPASGVREFNRRGRGGRRGFGMEDAPAPIPSGIPASYRGTALAFFTTSGVLLREQSWMTRGSPFLTPGSLRPRMPPAPLGSRLREWNDGYAKLSPSRERRLRDRAYVPRWS